MDIAHLRDFIAVVESGSLTRAAARLFVSQPAVSQRMSQLEYELGARLVERGPRGVVPTPAGRALYREAQQLVRRFDRLAEDIGADRHSVQGPVAVGLPTTVAVHLAPALFSWTKRHYPGVHLQLFESMSGYIQELLLVGRLDLAVLYRDDAAPRPAETALYAEDLYLVGRAAPGAEPAGAGEAAVAHASPGEVPLADLHGLPLVLPGPRSNLRSLVDRVFAESGAVPTIIADVDSLGAMMRIAESGEAHTVLPLSSVAALGSAPGLDVRRITDPVIGRCIAVSAAGEYYEPRDAVAAVRHGMVEVTARLAEQDAWPGIRLAPGAAPA
ncbi:LysR family transcriptional regulator [Murinocardiopsis flavida]|uniref:LysR family transcriptional regulator n=1 Tax=Murinocardiopsis flavida TaxID=645275 RepID=A0A2P8DRV4_9ACTN|nr:LysR substrate-binding domain-containing protein [Murinocardiopsis flavida]PSK99953.1 LysR family transcriptional regulator [Murinocardiopsis flavida]